MAGGWGKTACFWVGWIGGEQCINQISRRVCRLNHDLHAIDATSARRRGGVVYYCFVMRPAHWLISTQVPADGPGHADGPGQARRAGLLLSKK